MGVVNGNLRRLLDLSTWRLCATDYSACQARPGFSPPWDLPVKFHFRKTTPCCQIPQYYPKKVIKRLNFTPSSLSCGEEQVPMKGMCLEVVSHSTLGPRC